MPIDMDEDNVTAIAKLLAEYPPELVRALVRATHCEHSPGPGPLEDGVDPPPETD